MQPREHLQNVRSMFEHMIQVPDFEMIALADHQYLMPPAGISLHPERDLQSTATVHLGRTSEAKRTTQEFVMILQIVRGAVLLVDDPIAVVRTGSIEDDQTRRCFVHRHIKQVFGTARLYSYAEVFR